MTAAPPSCPYCNARLDGLSALAAGQRMTCPRCGETFTVTAAQAGSTGIQAGPSVPGPTAAAPDQPPRAARRNRLVAGAILGVMACMAAVGLTFALMTQKDRRAHDTGLSRPPRPFSKSSPVPKELPESVPLPPVTPLAPARLAGLGYLAPDTDLVAGLRVAEVLQDKDIRGLLDGNFQIGGFTFRLSDLGTWTGLAPRELDHIVLGVRARTLRFNLVVRTRRPYDAERVRAALKAQPEATKGKKSLYRFELPKLVLPLLLWCADDHTLIIGLRPSDLWAVPETPVEGLGQLAAELRPVIRERMGSVAPLWAAGQMGGWDKGLTGMLEGWLKPEAVRRVQSVRTFAAWLDPGPPLTAWGAFHGINEAAARALDDYFRSLKPRAGTLKTAPERDWLTVQFRTDLATVRGILGR